MPQKNLASKAVQRLEWKGKQVVKTMQRAEARAMGLTIFRCVAFAKRNHPGWKTRTGRAEKSVRKIKITRERGTLVGEWGSTLFYVRFLELHNGAFLRSAGDRIYPQLPGLIARFFKEMS